MRVSCFKEIGEKFQMDAAETEKKYKNIPTAFGRYSRKKKTVSNGSGDDRGAHMETENRPGRPGRFKVILKRSGRLRRPARLYGNKA